MPAARILAKRARHVAFSHFPAVAHSNINVTGSLVVGLKGLHRLDERRLAMESTFRGPARTALGNQVHSEARNRQYIVNLSETPSHEGW
jgi:hypothetical protein